MTPGSAYAEAGHLDSFPGAFSVSLKGSTRRRKRQRHRLYIMPPDTAVLPEKNGQSTWHPTFCSANLLLVNEKIHTIVVLRRKHRHRPAYRRYRVDPVLQYLRRVAEYVVELLHAVGNNVEAVGDLLIDLFAVQSVLTHDRAFLHRPSCSFDAPGVAPRGRYSKPTRTPTAASRRWEPGAQT